MTVARFIREQPAIARGTVPSPVPEMPGKVLIVGSGTSYHAARIAAPAFDTPVRVMIPSDALHDPDLEFGPDMLVVGVSQSGRSTATLAVLDRARAAGSPTLLVTGEPGGPGTVDIGCGPEPVGAKTKGFTATVLALQALSGHTPAAGLDVLLARLIDTSEPVVDRLVGSEPPTAVHIVTWGSWRPVADEGALKILETSLLPAEVWDVEEFLHGPHRRLSPGSLLVIVGDHDDPRGARADALSGFVERLGARVLDLRELLPRGAPVLAAVVPLQLLAVALTTARGLSPEADPFPDFHSQLGSKN